MSAASQSQSRTLTFSDQPSVFAYIFVLQHPDLGKMLMRCVNVLPDSTLIVWFLFQGLKFCIKRENSVSSSSQSFSTSASEIS